MLTYSKLNGLIKLVYTSFKKAAEYTHGDFKNAQNKNLE